MEAKPELDSELESFRQQWRSELKTKRPEDARKTEEARRLGRKGGSSSSKTPAHDAAKPSANRTTHGDDDNDEQAKTHSFEAPGGFTNTPQDHVHPETATKHDSELVSALDHFEAAVNKEAIGNLGDSLKLYRKAFRVRCRSCIPKSSRN